jgi:hypothetical protein
MRNAFAKPQIASRAYQKQDTRFETVNLTKPLRTRASSIRKLRSVRRFYAHRMVRDVVLQIRQAQQQLENIFIAAIGLRRRERLRYLPRVSHKPVDRLLVNWPRSNVRFANLFRSFHNHFHEVIQTNTATGQNRQNFSTASSHMAWASHRGVLSRPARGPGSIANISHWNCSSAQRVLDVTVRERAVAPPPS